ncbi:MAG: hypothetical protein L6R40_008506 [Gallowayella cf. fulva]|nr:MAG: hypothetical protein L6R40_008506 [Xanthomendoza cf. fulva]
MGFDEEFSGLLIQHLRPLVERGTKAGTGALAGADAFLNVMRLRWEVPAMDSRPVRPFLDHGSLIMARALHGSYAVMNILASLFIVLWLWRLWRFTISPSLHPERPRELPYWIPFLGRKSSSVTPVKIANHSYRAPRAFPIPEEREVRRWSDGSHEPYALTLSGETVYIITDPEDISAVYKNSKTLIFDGFVRNLMVTMEVQPSTIDKIYQVPDRSAMGPAARTRNPGAKHFIDLTHDRYVSQLSPGPRLDVLKSGFLQHMALELQMDRLPRRRCPPAATTRDPRPFRCYACVATLSSHATPISFSGSGCVTWIPISSRHTGAAWLITEIEDGIRALDIDDAEIATQLFLVHWSANANGYKLAFWYLAFILRSPSLYRAIFDEVAFVFRSPTGFTMDQILNHSPRMEAVFLEVLRLMNDPATSREILSDTFIGKKRLRVGAKLLIPYRQLRPGSHGRRHGHIVRSGAVPSPRDAYAWSELQTVWWRGDALPRAVFGPPGGVDVCRDSNVAI